MNECERIRDLFGEFQDRLLDSDKERLVNEHLHGCSICQEDFKWYGYTVHALVSLDRVHPPEDFMVQLRSKLYSTPQPSSSLQFVRNLFNFSPYLPLPVGVTTLAFIAVLGFLVYNNVPNPVVTTSEAMLSSSDSSARPSAGSTIQSSGSAARLADATGSVSGILGKGVQGGLTPGSAPMSQYAMSTPRPIGESGRINARYLPTLADAVGADNLTVESRSVDTAIDSLKRILPNIQGQLIGEATRDRLGEIVLGVRIPSNAYGHLTSELINHGAVAVGAGSDSQPPLRVPADSNNVVLYIRFVDSR
jgi:hypothetical protein